MLKIHKIIKKKHYVFYGIISLTEDLKNSHITLNTLFYYSAFFPILLFLKKGTEANEIHNDAFFRKMTVALQPTCASVIVLEHNEGQIYSLRLGQMGSP